jgi:hypothetical protein
MAVFGSCFQFPCGHVEGEFFGMWLVSVSHNSIEELDQAIRELCDCINDRPFLAARGLRTYRSARNGTLLESVPVGVNTWVFPVIAPMGTVVVNRDRYAPFFYTASILALDGV